MDTKPELRKNLTQVKFSYSLINATVEIPNFIVNRLLLLVTGLENQ